MTTSEPTEPELHVTVDLGDFHVGRSFSGHRIEDECGCPQQECGLVVPSVGCEHHDPLSAKTIRQGHTAATCPGAPA